MAQKRDVLPLLTRDELAEEGLLARPRIAVGVVAATWMKIFRRTA